MVLKWMARAQSGIRYKNCIAFLFLFFSLTAAYTQTPLNKGVLILSPRFFPGWQAQNVSYPFVLQEGRNKFKMYYAGSSSTQVNQSLWDQWVTGIVTSSDAVNWRYPDNYEQILFARKLMEGDAVNPDEQAAIFDAVYAVDAFVLKDGAVYKCWYTGWNGEIRHMGKGISDKINFRIGYATSPDGVTWTEMKGNAGAGAILGLGKEGDSDQFGVEDPCVLKDGDTYRMWYVGYDGKTRRIHEAVSRDGLTWTKKGVVLDAGFSGTADNLGARSPIVIRRGGQYELWYQGESSAKPTSRLLRATSPDGRTWRKAGEVALHAEPPHPSWPWTSLTTNGTERIIPGSILVHPDNSCQLFYARQFTGSRKATYAELTAPLSYLFTERINP